MPKIYRGEAVLMVQPASNITAKDIIDFVGIIDDEKKVKILPNTHVSISDIKINAFKDSKDKIALIIETKNTNNIQPALSEIIEYISNIDLVKQNVKEEQERLLKRSTELSNVIATSSELLDTYKKLLTKGNIVPIGFNPVEMNKSITDIKLEKLVVDQEIQRLKGGIEIAGQLYVMNKPVKPRKMMMVTLAGIAGLFPGMFWAFFMDYLGKIKGSSS
jgi:AAA15 family ATPase/GTPase